MFLIEAGYDAAIAELTKHLAYAAPVGPDEAIVRAHEVHPPPLYEDEFPCLTVTDTDALFQNSPGGAGVNEVFDTPTSVAFEVRTLAPAIPQDLQWDGRAQAQADTRRAMDSFISALGSYEQRDHGGYVFKVVRIQSGMFDQYGAPAGVDVDRGTLLWVRLAQVRADLLR